MGRLLFDFMGGQAQVVSVLNSLTGPGTKDKSFSLQQGNFLILKMEMC